jgi:hypothetical protein
VLAAQRGSAVQIIQGSSFMGFNVLGVRQCWHCKNFCIWWEDQLIYPIASEFPVPNEDLPEEIRADYLEAGSIAAQSPRGAAALLRLCIQKLCEHLGYVGKTIDEATADLLKQGIPETIVKAMDVVRVTGNNAVHPGELDIADNAEIVSTLARLVNVIAENRISIPKKVGALYDGLPESAREAAEKRNAKVLRDPKSSA